MRDDKKIIFYILVVGVVLFFSPFAYLRYYYENFSDGHSEFFSDIGVCVINEKNDSDYEVFENDSDKNVIYIPSKYRKYKFYFSGEIVNGIKDVYVSVNNKPVQDVSLSFPQGMNFFWDSFYIVKRFSFYANIKSGRNVIILKSGKATEKIIVQIGD